MLDEVLSTGGLLGGGAPSVLGEDVSVALLAFAPCRVPLAFVELLDLSAVDEVLRVLAVEEIA